MTIYDAITNCDNTYPNSISTATKIDLLSQLDGLIKSELLDDYERNEGEADISEFSAYDSNMSTAAQQATDLLIPFPYDIIYVHWLVAHCYLLMEETAKYNNYINLYNMDKATFERWYVRTHSVKKQTKITCF